MALLRAKPHSISKTVQCVHYKFIYIFLTRRAKCAVTIEINEEISLKPGSSKTPPSIKTGNRPSSETNPSTIAEGEARGNFAEANLIFKCIAVLEGMTNVQVRQEEPKRWTRDASTTTPCIARRSMPGFSPLQYCILSALPSSAVKLILVGTTDTRAKKGSFPGLLE